MFDLESLRIIKGGLGEKTKSSGEKKPEELPVEKEKDNEIELKEKMEQEKKEAKERFKNLIDLVSREYENLPEAMKKDYISHNEEILDGAIELGMKKGFTKEELEKLELSAILHDKTKAKNTPEKYRDIPNYTLAIHAETAAKEVPDILTDEYLKGLNIQGDPEEIRQEVSRAILEHMGPHPGFMDEILKGVNAELEKRGGKKIEHPSAEGKLSEALLAADMKSLAGEKGRKKVLSIRSNVEFFIRQDKKLVEEYEKYGIDLSQGEAALLSGFDSAYQAYDMQKDEENREWVNQSIEDSKKTEYDFPGSKKTISWTEASVKKGQYEDAKKLEEIKKRLKEAA
jgi:hypothetical protein